MEKIIEFKNVSFKYEDESENVLNNVSLELFSGQFTCILGHNGSGKSTLAKLMNALLLPTSGKVISFGYDTSDEKNEINVRKNVGMVFQNPDNQIVATIVEDDVAFGPENLGLPREEIRERVDKALEITDMTAFKRSEPHKLSGGQKHRVAIAGVLSMEPEVLVLDEPTAGLDPVGKKALLSLIKEYNRTTGNTVIFVSHSMDDVAAVSDRVVVMSDGKAALSGTVKEVYSQGERLLSLGLDVPEITRIFLELKNAGFSVPDDVYTVSDGANALLDFLKKRGAYNG